MVIDVKKHVNSRPITPGGGLEDESPLKPAELHGLGYNEQSENTYSAIVNSACGFMNGMKYLSAVWPFM